MSKKVKTRKKKKNIEKVKVSPVKKEQLALVAVDKKKLSLATIKENEVKYETYNTEDADIVLVAYGTTARIAMAAMTEAREDGIKVGLIRPITLWPFPEKIIAETAKNVKAMISVEMSMGQMIEDIKLAANGACPVEFCGRTGGMVPTPAEILEAIRKVK